MNEAEINHYIQSLAATLPTFPDGRIDYTNSAEAPILLVFLECKGEILLMKRSTQVSNYQGMWSSLAGFIDTVQSVQAIAARELCEELDITDGYTLSLGDPYFFEDATIQKRWLRIPLLASFNTKPNPMLDWEHTEYAWVRPEHLTEYELVPGTIEALERALS